MSLTARLLKAKHWQLFTITFGLPVVLEIILMSFMFSTLLRFPATGQPPDPAVIFSPLFMAIMAVFFVLMLCCMSVLLVWQWAVATGLQYKIPADAEMKVKKFRILFAFPWIYFLLLFMLMGFFFGLRGNMQPESMAPAMPFVFLIVFPLHIFSMFCIFYSMYFVAKTLKTAELKRAVSFSDFGGDFFLIWFYPIGIWFLQPRINNLVEPTPVSSEILDHNV